MVAANATLNSRFDRSQKSIIRWSLQKLGEDMVKLTKNMCPKSSQSLICPDHFGISGLFTRQVLHEYFNQSFHLLTNSFLCSYGHILLGQQRGIFVFRKNNNQPVVEISPVIQLFKSVNKPIKAHEY